MFQLSKHMFHISGDTFEEGFEKEPEYSGGIEKAFEDYDKFYDDYEDTYSNTSSGGTTLHLTYWLSILVICIGLAGLFSWKMYMENEDSTV